MYKMEHQEVFFFFLFFFHRQADDVAFEGRQAVKVQETFIMMIHLIHFINIKE